MRFDIRAMLLAMVATAGCAPQTAEITSALVGCPAKEIMISKQMRGWNTEVWKAECKGKEFVCSANHLHENPVVSCEEAPQPPPAPAESAPAVPAAPTTAAAPPALPAGCQYDTQCKGERICRDGQCADPVPAPSAQTSTP